MVGSGEGIGTERAAATSGGGIASWKFRENKPETGLLPTKVLRSDELEMT